MSSHLALLSALKLAEFSRRQLAGFPHFFLQSLGNPHLDNRLPRYPKTACLGIQRLDDPIGKIDVHASLLMPRATGLREGKMRCYVLPLIKHLFEILRFYNTAPSLHFWIFELKSTVYFPNCYRFNELRLWDHISRLLMRIGITHPPWIGSQVVQRTMNAHQSTVEDISINHRPPYKGGWNDPNCACCAGQARRRNRRNVLPCPPRSAC